MSSCVLRLLLNWMSNSAESICRKFSEMLRRPALHAFIIYCGIARANTLTDSYNWFLPKAQPFLNFMVQSPKSISYIITLPKYTVLRHWWIVYANLLLCWNTPCFITLLSETPTKTLSWAKPNPNTLFRYTQLYYIAEVNLSSLHCQVISNSNTLLRNSLH